MDCLVSWSPIAFEPVPQKTSPTAREQLLHIHQYMQGCDSTQVIVSKYLSAQVWFSFFTLTKSIYFCEIFEMDKDWNWFETPKYHSCSAGRITHCEVLWTSFLLLFRVLSLVKKSRSLILHMSSDIDISYVRVYMRKTLKWHINHFFSILHWWISLFKKGNDGNTDVQDSHAVKDFLMNRWQKSAVTAQQYMLFGTVTLCFHLHLQASVHKPFCTDLKGGYREVQKKKKKKSR